MQPDTTRTDPVVILTAARALRRSGGFEEALIVATRASVAFLHKGRCAEAAEALCVAADVLCSLNQPKKALPLAEEATTLAKGAGELAQVLLAAAMHVRALLTLGELGRAEAELSAVEPLGRSMPPSPASMQVSLISAELALATDRTRQARALSEAVLVDAGAHPSLLARAHLILGRAAIRDHAYKGALRLLNMALADLVREPNVEIAWQVESVLAEVARKLGRSEVALQHAAAAAEFVNHAALPMSDDVRVTFLGGPTVREALGSERVGSGWSQSPPPPVVWAPPDSTEEGVRALAPVSAAFRRLGAHQTLSEMLPALLELTMGLCGAGRGTIVLVDPRSHGAEVSRADPANGLQAFDMDLARTVLGVVIATGRVFSSGDARLSDVLDVRADKVISVLCAPLVVSSRVLGAVYLDMPGVAAAFEPQDVEAVEILTHHGALAVDNLLVREHATRDGLTLLYNQTHVEECLEREIASARRHNRQCGVLMIDVDDFKRTNDWMGHAAGSDLLRSLAPMLRGAVRSIDVAARIEKRDPIAIVARYGGDEFEIVLPETGKDGLEAVAGRILEAMRVTSFPFHGQAVSVTVSIGGACFPADAETARDLMCRADDALYQAKQHGKNRYQAYERPAPAPAQLAERTAFSHPLP